MTGRGGFLALVRHEHGHDTIAAARARGRRAAKLAIARAEEDAAAEAVIFRRSQREINIMMAKLEHAARVGLQSDGSTDNPDAEMALNTLRWLRNEVSTPTWQLMWENAG